MMRGNRFYGLPRYFCYSWRMSELRCYRCGESLAALSLPLSRLEECPSCSVHLHCCRLCVYFDPAVTEQCTEDDAEEVREKIRANFCDYFKPGYIAFDPAGVAAEERARHSLDSLFGGADEEDDQGDGQGDDQGDDQGDGNGNGDLGDAEDLFR